MHAYSTQVQTQAILGQFLTESVLGRILGRPEALSYQLDCVLVLVGVYWCPAEVVVAIQPP